MGEKGVGKLSRETPPPREGEPMGARVSGDGHAYIMYTHLYRHLHM